MDFDREAEALCTMQYQHLKEICRLEEMASRQGEEGVLMCLWAQDAPMLSGEIGERMGLTTGRVANILRQLEGKRLIQRLHGADDRRQVYVTLTDTGRQRAAELRQTTVVGARRLLAWLGEADAREMIRLVGRCLRFAQENEL